MLDPVLMARRPIRPEPTIAVLNESTVVTDAEVATVVAALQVQVDRDFGPAYGLGAKLVAVPKGTPPPKKAWQLVICNYSDYAGALGYHDVTAEGLPLGKVFAATDQQYGLAWSVTASHELLEMLCDPDVNLTVFVQTSNAAGRLYAYESADAVEADADGYQVNGVLVSNFVYPAFWESFRQPGSTKFDHRGLLTKPFELRPGGYLSVYDLAGGSGWQQVTAAAVPGHQAIPYVARPRLGSRRERRRTPRSYWQPSTAGLPL